jgi:hypothetical protein
MRTSSDNTPLCASHCQYSAKGYRSCSIKYASKGATITAHIRHCSCTFVLTVNTAEPRKRGLVHRHKARISLIIRKLMWAQLITYFALLLFNSPLDGRNQSSTVAHSVTIITGMRKRHIRYLVRTPTDLRFLSVSQTRTPAHNEPPIKLLPHTVRGHSTPPI